MLVKLFVIVLLLVILGSLASALFYLVRDTHENTNTIKALTWRIGLSIACFLLLLVGAATGLIQPHGIVG
ncbi:MAG: twin transmembrane helix small protein [Thioalkalivibrio sp.]|nr:twin transmembrane helix small protein [Thioalkalivibrio sp.]